MIILNKTTLFVSLSFFLTTFLPDSGGRAFSKTYKIGVSLPLSGDFAKLGKQYVAGMELAQRLLPEAKNIKLIVSDDGCDKDLAELAIDDIRNADVMLVTGFLCNDPVYVAANRLRDSSIPILVSAARSNRILQDRTRYRWNIWQLAATDADITKLASTALARRWKSIPYAIINDGTAFNRIQSDEFRMRMEEAGNKPRIVDVFRPAQSTQANLIRRLSKAGIKAVYLAASASDVTLIGREAIELGINMEIVAGEALSLLPYIEDNKDIPKGLFAIMPPPSKDLPPVRILTKKIEEAKLEPHPYLLLGYATMQVVAAYLNDTRPKFIGKRFSTILGNVEFDTQGKNIFNQYRLYQWNGKKFLIAE